MHIYIHSIGFGIGGQLHHPVGQSLALIGDRYRQEALHAYMVNWEGSLLTSEEGANDHSRYPRRTVQ